MAKCRVCKRDAVIRIDYANASFCEEHFISFYERKIKKTLKRVNLKGKCVLVALSGGKDSVSLLYALNKIKEELGFKLKALHIKLGIDSYSEESYKISVNLCEKLGVPLIVYDIEKEFGWGIPDAVNVMNQPACSVCGLVKRWIMNKIALEEGCDYVATGHNVDDVNAFGLKAMLTFRVDDVIRMPSPILEPKPDFGLAGRLRPQFYLTEFENSMYAQLNGLEYVYTQCPLATRSTQHKYKAIWEHINKVNPVGKINFAKSLLAISEKSQKGNVELVKCKVCGQPTIKGREVCSFCRVKDRVENRLKVVKKI